LKAFPFLGRAFIALFFLCGSTTPLFATDEVRLEVPFFRQRLNHCGPAALASVLRYHGDSISPDEIANTVFSENAGGTLTLDLLRFAKRRGMTVTSGPESPESLKEHLRSGRPVLVLVDKGFWVLRRGHYLVVTGFSKDGYYVHDGREPHRLISEKTFLPEWERAGKWSLVVRGPAAGAEVRKPKAVTPTATSEGTDRT